MSAAVEPNVSAPLKRHRLVVLGLFAIALVAGVAVAVTAPQRAWARQLADDDPAVRAYAVRKLGGRKGYDALPIIRRMITDDPDPAVRAQAAFAAMKLGDAASIEPIQRAIDAAGDHESAARMLESLVRLSGPRADVAEFVERCRRSGKPYPTVGAAAARIEWYDARALDELLALSVTAPEAPAAFAREEARHYVALAAALIGGAVDLRDPWTPERVAALRAWWAAHGSDRVLRDALWIRRAGDVNVHEIERLEHAREEITGTLGLR